MKSCKIAAVVVVLVAGVLGLVRLRQNTVRLQARASELRHRNEELVRTRDEHRRLETLAVRAQRNDEDAKRAIRVDLEKARREVAELEQNAQQGRAKLAEQAAAVETNRDPEKGPTRLEHFQNMGRQTPGAAFQTLVWAALKGEDGTVAGTLCLVGTARVKAEAVLTGLPETARQKYSTPEKLAALFFTAELLAKSSILHVLGPVFDDPTHASLALRMGVNGQEVKLPMQMTEGGWQMSVSERQIDGIQKQLRGESEPSMKN